MKTLAFLWILILAIPGYAVDIEQRLAELENKTAALEKTVAEKLNNCNMTYQHHGYRLNLCDKGTFARSVTDVGGGSLQLECGYYQLQCKR